MRNFVLFIIIYCLCSVAIAGGLNPIAGIGTRHGGSSGALADDAATFCYNPAGLIDFQDTYLDAAASILLPRFTLENGLGKTKSRPGVYYLLPTAGYVQPLGERWRIGFGLTVPYGLGAQFDRDLAKGIFESETLITLTNFTPALAVRLCDSVSIGAGLNIGWSQFKYLAPFDLELGDRRLFLPLLTDSDGTGWGIGGIFGVQLEPTKKLKLQLSYLTPSQVWYSGNTEMTGPLKTVLRLQDGLNSELTFPDRAGGTIAYQATDKLLLAFSGWWYGYSRNMKKMSLRFHDLPLVKTTTLDWQDNYSLHWGLQYKPRKDWQARLGVGYQTAAITKTASQLTPDVTGWDIASGISFSHDFKKHGELTLNFDVIYGWGKQKTSDVTFKAETWTFGLGGSYRF